MSGRRPHWSDQLVALHACGEAVRWARRQKSPVAAWRACKRADWMLWIAARCDDVPRKKLVLAACACAETALVHVPEGEKRPAEAIRIARAWCRGRATLGDVRTAADAAYAAYADSAAAAAAAERRKSLAYLADLVREILQRPALPKRGKS